MAAKAFENQTQKASGKWRFQIWTLQIFVSGYQMVIMNTSLEGGMKKIFFMAIFFINGLG
jgi:hypothetical protein